MVIHLVLMSFDDPADADRSAELLRSLADEIDGIDRVEVGRNFRPSDRAYDLGVLMEFASRDALDAFLAHPAHESAAEFYRARRSAAATCDFEA